VFTVAIEKSEEVHHYSLSALIFNNNSRKLHFTNEIFVSVPSAPSLQFIFTPFSIILGETVDLQLILLNPKNENNAIMNFEGNLTLEYFSANYPSTILKETKTINSSQNYPFTKVVFKVTPTAPGEYILRAYLNERSCLTSKSLIVLHSGKITSVKSYLEINKTGKLHTGTFNAHSSMSIGSNDSTDRKFVSRFHFQ